MSSPFIINGGAEPCTAEKCEPFYIREWETMIVGTLIAATLLYVMCACGYERFASARGGNPYPSLANSQRILGMYDNRPGHVGPRGPERFASAPQPTLGDMIAREASDIRRGLGWGSQGPQVSKFTDFAKVDSIDELKSGEPNPTHQPETPDDVLEMLVRPSYNLA
jgi:hypothetical protein